jgi:hypothetical protein
MHTLRSVWLQLYYLCVSLSKPHFWLWRIRGGRLRPALLEMRVTVIENTATRKHWMSYY